MDPPTVMQSMIGDHDPSEDEDEGASYVRWGPAREACGYNQCAAVSIAALRLMLWHLLQPAAYWLTLYAYSDVLSPKQWTWGLLVGVREAIYAAGVLAATAATPSFLLVTMRESDRKTSCTQAVFDLDSSLWARTVYVLAPEKYVVGTLMRPCNRSVWILALGSLVVFDIASAAALVTGLGAGNLPIALAVGYILTFVGGFLGACFGCIYCLKAWSRDWS